MSGHGIQTVLGEPIGLRGWGRAAPARTHSMTGLRAAMESTTVVNRAAGVIMAQTGRGRARAVSILRSASSNRNRKLREAAADILAALGEPDAATAFTPAGSLDSSQGSSKGNAHGS